MAAATSPKTFEERIQFVENHKAGRSVQWQRYPTETDLKKQQVALRKILLVVGLISALFFFGLVTTMVFLIPVTSPLTIAIGYLGATLLSGIGAGFFCSIYTETVSKIRL